MKDMPTSWLSWKRSLACKSQPSEVYDPQSLTETTAKVQAEAHHVLFGSRSKLYRSGCSRSIANLKDVIHSSRRMEGGGGHSGMPNLSPKSVESNDFVQSISHEAMIRDHECDHHHHNSNHHGHNHHGSKKLLSLDDIVAHHHPHPHRKSSNGSTTTMTKNVLRSSNNANVGSFYGTPLHHYYPHPAATPLHSNSNSKSGGNSLMKLSGCYDCKNPAVSLVVYKTNGGNGGSNGGAGGPVIVSPVCQRCGEEFPKFEALEKHHIMRHAVTELNIGDSSRNVVEIIFRTSWMRMTGESPDSAFNPRAAAVAVQTRTGSTGSTMMNNTIAGGSLKIERVLKVNNLARTLARFEAYREGVKIKAGKLPKKHPRCLADGNELLRFYGARLECNMREATAEGGPAVCAAPTCTACRIIRHGFGKTAAANGILTTATSGRAHEIVTSAPPPQPLMAMLVCRVIAGRVHKPLASASASAAGGGGAGTTPASAPPGGGFDSVAGGDTGPSAAACGAGLYSRFEELTVFSPRAILPCFVVLYRCS